MHSSCIQSVLDGSNKEYLFDPKHPEFKELVESLNKKLDETEKKKSKGSGKFAGKASKGKSF